MKRFFLVLFSLFILVSFTNCSKDEINDNSWLVGIWERSTITDNSTTVDKLVFRTNNTGLKINTINFDSGEVISSASEFNWELMDNTVALSEEGAYATYLINTEQQLVLTTLDEPPFNKVSDSTLKY